ncbi:MAG: hypothetical protein BSOLF_1966 [Candidatus Carbobacillus altaicus]|uniref:Uncharacterized protein n=1 Tax=Candidatus Carbonibacillus altaicus TaxID=2163959 RepID=A0A2R6XYI7_9BACL|nr:MAG: hypothetical protein BSOLF_1966 [Candidatus Carbobacillus altaicus]
MYTRFLKTLMEYEALRAACSTISSSNMPFYGPNSPQPLTFPEMMGRNRFITA